MCTLIEQKSTFTCRQKVGRGLRLCVDQDGNRVEDKSINVLHVMANESFAEFAETLQKEIEQETGVKFGILQIDLFSGITYTETRTVEKQISTEQAVQIVDTLRQQGFDKPGGSAIAFLREAVAAHRVEMAEELVPILPMVQELAEQKGAETPLSADIIAGLSYTETITEEKTVSYEDVSELMNYFEQKGYITKSGKIKDTMKNALLSGTLDLPQKYESARERFESVIKRADSKPPLRDASREVVVRLNKQVMISSEFRELWDKIKQKTTYRVRFDMEELVEKSVKDLQEMPPIPKARNVSQTAEIEIQNPGVTYREREMRTMDLQNTYEVLPDILRLISEETLIKRSDVARILHDSGRLADFLNNPQAFLEKSLEIIRRNRHALAIDGIKYIKLDGQEYYAQEIFSGEELTANLDKDAVAVKHSVYDYVIYDSSTIEKPFAVALDDDPDVKLFFKIPERFKIETPIGTYNPDWAVYLCRDGIEKLYFILETKGSTELWSLRTTEQMKIHCGKEHFKALNNGVDMQVATNWKDVKINL